MDTGYEPNFTSWNASENYRLFPDLEDGTFDCNFPSQQEMRVETPVNIIQSVASTSTSHAVTQDTGDDCLSKLLSDLPEILDVPVDRTRHHSYEEILTDITNNLNSPKLTLTSSSSMWPDEIFSNACRLEQREIIPNLSGSKKRTFSESSGDAPMTKRMCVNTDVAVPSVHSPDSSFTALTSTASLFRRPDDDFYQTLPDTPGSLVSESDCDMNDTEKSVNVSQFANINSDHNYCDNKSSDEEADAEKHCCDGKQSPLIQPERKQFIIKTKIKQQESKNVKNQLKLTITKKLNGKLPVRRVGRPCKINTPAETTYLPLTPPYPENEGSGNTKSNASVNSYSRQMILRYNEMTESNKSTENQIQSPKPTPALLDQSFTYLSQTKDEQQKLKNTEKPKKPRATKKRVRANDPEDNPEKRAHHNQNERCRRKTIKNLFDDLEHALILFQGSVKGTSKHNLLTEANLACIKIKNTGKLREELAEEVKMKEKKLKLLKSYCQRWL